MAKRYLPAHQRSETPPPMRLTARDKAIVQAIYEYRVLSSVQIEALLFPSDKLRGKRTVCQRRLQLLYHHQFIIRIPQPVVIGEGRAPFVYALDERGAQLVASQLGIDRADVGWQPKYNRFGAMFLEHLLAINEVRVVMKLISQDTLWNVTAWIDEAEFRTGAYAQQVPFRMKGARKVRIFPDGYFRLGQADTHQEAHFFLEVDQGTMSNARWQEKILAYREFRDNGLSERFYGTRHFRVLTVTTSQKRLKNLQKATQRVKGDHYFWFTTQEAIDIWQSQTILKPIWRAPDKDELLPLFPS